MIDARSVRLLVVAIATEVVVLMPVPGTLGGVGGVVGPVPPPVYSTVKVMSLQLPLLSQTVRVMLPDLLGVNWTVLE